MTARAGRARVPATLLAASLLTFALGAQAHQVGLSRGTYVILGARVTSTLTFARNELANVTAGRTPTSASGQSVDGSDALNAAARVVADAMHVAMAGTPCRTELGSVKPVAPDGMELSLKSDCPKTGNVSFRYDLVDVFEPGHRHIAELTAAGRVTTFVAYHGNTSFDVAQVATEHDGHPLLGFLRLGVEHVLTGWDHLAFLLGVALASFGARRRPGSGDAPSLFERARPLALAVTAFTVAHSITLAAGVFGLVFASPAWVEPLIALSIAYVGVENLVRRRPTAPYRMTFAFGLVHGMGFASALREISIPRAELPGALALFNVGVEMGQLLALVPVVVLLWWLAQRPAMLSRAVRGVSVALAAIGAVVFVTRVTASVHAARTGAIAATSAGTGSRGRAPRSGQNAAPSAEPRATSPDVGRLCRVINELPRLRRAECEHGKPGVILTSSCARKLDPAVSSGAISLSPDDLTACVAELSQRYETCAFVNDASAPTAVACEHVLHGNRDDGQTCRSSLECHPGSFCDGAGPLHAGVCHPPRSEGAACGLAIDPLTAYVQPATRNEHRECDGECIQNRCRQPRGSVASR